MEVVRRVQVKLPAPSLLAKLDSFQLPDSVCKCGQTIASSWDLNFIIVHRKQLIGELGFICLSGEQQYQTMEADPSAEAKRCFGFVRLVHVYGSHQQIQFNNISCNLYFSSILFLSPVTNFAFAFSLQCFLSVFLITECTEMILFTKQLENIHFISRAVYRKISCTLKLRMH